MYQAKQQGRGRFVMFDPQMHAAAVARLNFERDLREAVAQCQLQVHYQPIVDVRSRRLTGFEALCRWKHQQRGWVSPVEFIPLAEDTGVIVPLGFHVLREACRQLKEWQGRWPELANLTMSVNLSRKQLPTPGVVERIRKTIAEAGISPANLKLEITESSLMGDVRSALDVLKQIRDAGIGLHVDDFGTGYSSLSCIQNFPLTGLKIDRDFVRDMTTKPDNAAIIKTVIALAHALTIPLVAEGVETIEQISALEKMGCDQAQGYLFAKPMDGAAATTYIGEHIRAAIAA